MATYIPNPDNFIGPAQNQPYVAQPGFIGPTLPSGYKTYSSNATSGAPIGGTTQTVPVQTQPVVQQTNNQPQQNQNSGARTITEGDAVRMGLDWNNLPGGYTRAASAAPSGPSQAQLDAQLNSAIDSAFNPQMGYLNEAESMLRKDYPSIQAELQSQTDANKATLAANKQKTIDTTDKNINSAKMTKDDALAQARRLFANLQRSNNARFGGASSAGEAVSEIQGQEMQRQQGNTQRDFGKFMQEAQAQQAQIEKDYNAQSLQLETQKQSALNQANRDFQSKLLEISRLKAETESNKAMKRLEALQNLRNQVYAVNQQNAQFQQQLDAMKYQQQLQVQTYQQTNAGLTTPSYTQSSSNLSTAGQTSGANQPVTQYAGAISSSGAYPIASLPDGRMRYSDGTVK